MPDISLFLSVPLFASPFPISPVTHSRVLHWGGLCSEREKKKEGGKAIVVGRIMFLRRFAAVCAASSCFRALRPYHRPGILTALRVLPTTACDMTASIRHFVSTVPLASVATAVSRASNKSKRQPPAPPTAGRAQTNKGRQPCNRTQEKLDELLQKNNGTPNYSLYFFNVASKKGDWKSWESQYKDKLERCVDCGLKISEHRAATSSSTPKTVAKLLKASAKIEFKVPPRADRRRIGRDGFDTEVHDLIRRCDPTTNQESKALVLMSASGVGKDVCDDDISCLLPENVAASTVRVPHDLPRTEPGVEPYSARGNSHERERLP